MKYSRVLLWLPMPFIAIANGILRQSIIIKYVNELTAHQISTFTLIGLIAVYVSLIFRRLELKSYGDALLTGVIWLLLTLAFEFSMGFFVSRLTLRQMLADYNLMEGHLWPIFLLALTVLPTALFHLRRN